jgi:hypothetical protein
MTSLNIIPVDSSKNEKNVETLINRKLKQLNPPAYLAPNNVFTDAVIATASPN